MDTTIEYKVLNRVIGRCRKMGLLEDAEDIAQEALLIAWKLGHYNDHKRVLNTIYPLIDSLQKRYSMEEQLEESYPIQPEPPTVEEIEDRIFVRSLFTGLKNRRNFSIFLDHYVMDYQKVEIGKMRKLSAERISQILSKTCRELRWIHINRRSNARSLMVAPVVYLLPIKEISANRFIRCSEEQYAQMENGNCCKLIVTQLPGEPEAHTVYRCFRIYNTLKYIAKRRSLRLLWLFNNKQDDNEVNRRQLWLAEREKQEERSRIFWLSTQGQAILAAREAKKQRKAYLATPEGQMELTIRRQQREEQKIERLARAKSLKAANETKSLPPEVRKAIWKKHVEFVLSQPLAPLLPEIAAQIAENDRRVERNRRKALGLPLEDE